MMSVYQIIQVHDVLVCGRNESERVMDGDKES